MFMSTRYKKKDPAWRKKHLFSVQDSLAKLFECLTIEYSCGKLISPKYKHFKSQKIDFEQKTRLNNAIWRAWYIQYKLSKRARFFLFDPPFSDNTVHSTPQAVILEGKYWKRRLDNVSREYKKWRRFYTVKFVSGADSAGDTTDDVDLNEDFDEEDGDDDAVPPNIKESMYEDPEAEQRDLFFDSFAAASDLPDTLFSSLETQKCNTQDRRKANSYENSTVIQPTLDMLNPCFDELIENFDWLAPEWTRTLDPVEENPTCEGLELMNIDSSSILTEGISTPTKQDECNSSQQLQENVGRPVKNLYEGTDLLRNNFRDSRNISSVQVVDTGHQLRMDTYQARNRTSSDSNLGLHAVKPSVTVAPTVLMPSTLTDQRAKDQLGARTRTQSLGNADVHPSFPGVNTVIRNINVVDTEMKTTPVMFQPAAVRLGAYADLPPQLQAPNLTAHLQAVLASRDTQNIPRNKSDTQLCLMESAENMKPVPNRKTSGPRKDGSIAKSKRAKITRNVSDSNLSQMETESARVSRRHTNRSQSLTNEVSRGLPKNLSDSNLVGMSSIQQHRRILPKNCVTIVPFTNTAVLTKPTAPATVPCVPLYPGQGPTYVVNPQPPGNNEPASTRLYMPKITSATTSSYKTVPGPAPDVSVIAVTESSGSTSKRAQPETIIYQLASDGKNIIPVTSFVNSSSKSTTLFPTSNAARPAMSEKENVQNVPAQQAVPRVVSAPELVIDAVPASVATTSNASVPVVQGVDTKTQKGAAEMVMPLQGLTNQQLVSLARLLQSREGHQHQQATIAYLELLQQQLNTLLLQQQQQMLKARQERVDVTPSVQSDSAAVNVAGLKTSTNLSKDTSEILSRLTGGSAATVKLPTSLVGAQSTAGALEYMETDPTSTKNFVIGANTMTTVGPRVKVTPMSSVPHCSNVPSYAIAQTSTTSLIGQVSPSAALNNTTAIHPILTRRDVTPIAQKTNQPYSCVLEPSPGQAFVIPNKPEQPSKTAITLHTTVLSSNANTEMGVREENQQTAEVGSLASAESPQGLGKLPLDREKKRMSHISAEKRRRVNIKSSFDILMQMVPSVQNERTAKASKAIMLEKAAEYVLYLHREKDKGKEKIDAMTQDIAELNAAISLCQSQLPASGVSMNKKSQDEVQSSFVSYVKEKIAIDHKYWIFSLMLKPLFTSFNTNVLTGSLEEFINSALRWLDQHCSLLSLRPAVLASLRELSTSTNFLTDPSQLPHLAANAARSEDPTVLKPTPMRGNVDTNVVPETPVVNHVIQDVGNTLITPYAWTVQFSKVSPAKEQSDPT